MWFYYSKISSVVEDASTENTIKIMSVYHLIWFQTRSTLQFLSNWTKLFFIYLSSGAWKAGWLGLFLMLVVLYMIPQDFITTAPWKAVHFSCLSFWNYFQWDFRSCLWLIWLYVLDLFLISCLPYTKLSIGLQTQDWSRERSHHNKSFIISTSLFLLTCSLSRESSYELVCIHCPVLLEHLSSDLWSLVLILIHLSLHLCAPLRWLLMDHLTIWILMQLGSFIYFYNILI